MCNIRSLITNSLFRLEESDGGEISEESLTSEYILVNIYLSGVACVYYSVGHVWSRKYL